MKEQNKTCVFSSESFYKIVQNKRKSAKKLKKLCNYDIIDSDNKTTSRQLESEGVL